jgi:hypothetical protein
MPEELGKIEKPAVAEFKGGRKIFFVPLVLPNKSLPQEFRDKCNTYWDQVKSQLNNLESKLGQASHIFHELVSEDGDKGLKAVEQLEIGSLHIIRQHIEKGSILEATENNDILTELMDWSRCLSSGLQSQKAFSTIYQAYTEASNKRNEYVAKKINETLKEDESGIIFLGEGHHIQFPTDAQVFYIAPPALDDLKRWIRDFESKSHEQEESTTDEKQ